ncbi:hypothetical protein LAV77_04985 [Priestia megaterium]|uniref:ZmpA/ZmpB/ZmpC family metallo-endopeptidase-related protein n=1 Tax=Priestia megaterium TaxID=1404 RepID=UPI002B24E94F|nr:ZmpA/ZmpB/ZmpC family metallo-endopeptidase-related protein [Priestia megaterium]MEB2264149.1 hypothetical protein [Priestia megaterium]
MLGAGTVESPYIIENIQDLQNVQNNLTANYELAGDIDATGFNFIPIGGTSLVADQSFTGTLNGKGYKIINLKINQTANYAGLFTYLNGATVTDLGLENVDITGGMYVGALTSYMSSSTVQQCYATGKVTCTQYLVGGFIGTTISSIVEDCWTNVNVKATTTNSTYMKYTGGFAGRDASGSKFRQCYSLGTSKNNTTAAKGFVGFVNTNTGTARTSIYACFYDKTTSGCTTDGEGGLGAVGYTTSQMQTRSIYYAYDKEIIWFAEDGVYPSLRVFDHTVIQKVAVNLLSTVETILAQSRTVRTSRRQPKTSLNIYASNYVIRNIKRFGNGFISEVHSISTQENRSVRSIYVNISSDISPIYSTIKRKTKVKRANVSSVDKIQGIINFISNQKPVQIVGVSFYKSHYSNYDLWTNNSVCSFKVNSTENANNLNDTISYVIENRSSVEVV